MTRKEQMYKDWEENIANAYEDEIDDTCFSAFLDGVKWADEHSKPDTVNKQEFIEKAVEWVKNRDNVEKYLHYQTSLIDGFANALRKYLEE